MRRLWDLVLHAIWPLHVIEGTSFRRCTYREVWDMSRTVHSDDDGTTP